MSFVWFILIGLAAGWIGAKIVGGEGNGFWINLLVGVVGSVLGGWVYRFLGIGDPASLVGGLICAVVGAIILLLIVRLFQRRA